MRFQVPILKWVGLGFMGGERATFHCVAQAHWAFTCIKRKKKGQVVGTYACWDMSFEV